MTTSKAVLAQERPPVVLEYLRGGAASKTCPDEATFRALVAARLGYDPFSKDGQRALRVELAPKGAGVTGNVELTADGKLVGNRSMSSGAGDCYELVASLALASAVAVDPERATAEPAPAPPAPPAPPPPAPSAPPTNASPASGESRARAFFDIGGLVSIGMQPSPAAGLLLGGGMRGGVWSIGVEAAAFLPSKREESFGTVQAHTLYGSLVPCMRAGGLIYSVDFCAVASVGALFSDAQRVARSRPVTDRYTTVGPRIGLRASITRGVGFEVTGEVPFALPRVHLVIDDAGTGREVWATSTAGFIGGAKVVLNLH